MRATGNNPHPPTDRRVAAAAPSCDLSVVIPVFNEEDCIRPLWKRLYPVLAALAPDWRDWEVLFVDDGSRDRSRERLLGLHPGRHRVRVVSLERNSGQTAALDAGFRAARGRFIVTLDADLQNPPEEILKLLDAADGVDMVYGRRRRRVDSMFKRIGSRIGNGVRNAITGHKVSDTGCSLKLYRAEALRRIPLFTGMHRFLPTLFAFHGYRIREVDVAHDARAGGVSKYGNLERAVRGLADCFAVRWMRPRALTYRGRELEDGGGDAD